MKTFEVDGVLSFSFQENVRETREVVSPELTELSLLRK